MRQGKFACAASLPTFLADSHVCGEMFFGADRARNDADADRRRRYLASHYYAIVPGVRTYACTNGSLDIALRIALSILMRGDWTLPSFAIESELAQRAKNLGWQVERSGPPESGDLRMHMPAAARRRGLTTDVLALVPPDGEAVRSEVVTWLKARIDPASASEAEFVDRDLSQLPLEVLCAIDPQRDVTSMGADPAAFPNQRVDFALEMIGGDRLVIEIDGSQHLTDPAQAALDARRDTALRALGWKTLRIPTGKIGTEGYDHAAILTAVRAPTTPQSGTADRQSGAKSLFWSSTAATRIQCLIVEAILAGAVPADGTIQVAITEDGTDAADLAVAAFNHLVGALGALYDVAVPRCERVDVAVANADSLVVDIDVFYPQRPVTQSASAVAWSRPAMRAVEMGSQPIPVPPGCPRWLPRPPSESILDELVRDLFRKDGMLRSPKDGRSDQADVAKRILQGKDTVALMPTGAGKSLPYMLAGLLLPGMTLYVGPLVSLLQDQVDRLRALGITHVKYISSALGPVARQDALRAVQDQRIRFLLVAPERFLTVPFLTALKNRPLNGGDISQVVVDECHCVSEWGHEFRPAYLSLGRIARARTARFGTSAPIVGLTGTASTIVLSDVLRELGIHDADACIRASDLDRPEIAIHCTRVAAPNLRERRIEDSVRQALQDYPKDTDGILVFCPFRRGREMGVFAVAAHLSTQLPGIDVRFFCGGDDPWRQYAVFALRCKAAQLDDAAIQRAIPQWARNANGVTKWSELKAEVQRDYTSPVLNGYRVLVATKAFGMGIDKPSIRKVIHAAAPTSPEAFYQEIGRAGRDRKNADAELLFYDGDASVTDAMLNPGTNYEQAESEYEKFRKNNKYGGGDFLRTFYFHTQAFQDPDASAKRVAEVATLLHIAAHNGKQLQVPFMLKGEAQVDETAIEYSLVRLMHLGVVETYTKQYNARVFDVDATPAWWQARALQTNAQKIAALAAHVAACFADFIHRYRLQGGDTEIADIRRQTRLKDLYMLAASLVMKFTYAHVERQRRRATRDMLEIARAGLRDSSEMREKLKLYLQVSERYTQPLEELQPTDAPSRWIDILKSAESPQELAELHGATQRVLGSYPDHPGLLFLSGASRPIQSTDDRQRSEEEFAACIDLADERELDPNSVLTTFEWFLNANLLQRSELRPVVMRSIGLLMLKVGRDAEELIPCLQLDDVRARYLSNKINAAAEAAAITEE